MYTLAIICLTLGGFSLAIATLLMLMGATKPEKPRSITDLIVGSFTDIPYGIRIFCRYAYLILLPLGAILHYFS